MAKTLREILDMSWECQTEGLQNMTPRELAVLFSYLHRRPIEEKDQKDFEKFYLAIYTILRDQGERFWE